MAKLTADREALLLEGERRTIFRRMLLFRLCLITLIFAILCWVFCAAVGPIRFADHRPVAFWLIPASLFALVYYSYALFTEFSGDPGADRWWRIISAAFVMSPMVVYFTVTGMMFLFFTISEVELAVQNIPFWPG